MEGGMSEAQKRGRQLLKEQKEQQRLLAMGGSREESGRKLAELREDIRIAKERRPPAPRTPTLTPQP